MSKVESTHLYHVIDLIVGKLKIEKKPMDFELKMQQDELKNWEMLT